MGEQRNRKIERHGSGAAIASRRLQFEGLEQRIALTVNVIESFPTFVGEATVAGSSQLGYSVAIDGDWAVAGAPWEDALGRSSSGTAHVYHKSNGSWTHVTTLTSSDPQSGEQFGTAVDISGGTIAVGAPGNSWTAATTGSVYVFQIDNGSWHEQSVLYASDARAGGRFGQAVALEGDTLVVGAPTDYWAAAYAFERQGEQWSEVEKFTQLDLRNGSDAEFGGSVSVSGDTIVVSAATRNDYRPYPGAVQVYHREGGDWSYQATLNPPADRPEVRFSGAVAVEGDTIMIGQPDAHPVGSFESQFGGIHVYRASGDDWSLVQTVASPTLTPYERFGESFAMDGGFLVVGAAGGYPHVTDGSAYLLHRNEDGLWAHLDEWQPVVHTIGSFFGYAVAIDGTNVFVSDLNFEYSRSLGAVHTYEIAEAPAEVSLLDVEAIRSDRIQVDYAVQGDASPLRFKVYRSVDAILDPNDLAFVVNAAEVETPPGLSSYEFDPGAFDAARPYLIVTASTAGIEHRVGDNWLAFRQDEPVYGRQELPMPTFGTANDGRPIAFNGQLARDEDRVVVATGSYSAADGGAFVFERRGDAWVQTAHLLMRDTAGELVAGSPAAVAIDDRTIVLALPQSQLRGNSSGAVLVYRLVEGLWIQESLLTLADAMSYEEFGRAIALDGDTLAISSYGGRLWYQGDRLGPSSVHIYERQDGSWAKTARLDGDVYEPGFGGVLALSEYILIVGFSSSNGYSKNVGPDISLYQRSANGWAFRDRVSSPDNAARPSGYANVRSFGVQLDLEGDRLAVAAVESDSGLRSLAYLYRIVDGRLEFETRLRSSSTLGTDYNANPYDIELSGGVLLLGGALESIGGNLRGVVSLFTERADGSWVEQPSIYSPVKTVTEQFGSSFALDGGELLVMAPHSHTEVAPAGALRRFQLTNVNADVQLYDLRHVTSQVVAVNYATQGLVSGFQLTVYRSTDAVLTPDDLSHVHHSQSLATGPTIGTLEFAARAYDVQRPYLVAVATPSLPESSTENNVATLRQVEPSFAIEQLPLLLPDQSGVTGNAMFGHAVSIDGNWAVVGASQSNAWAGEAYVMEKAGGHWMTRAVLKAPADAPIGFGSAVAIRGNTVVVGAPGPANARHDGGAAFVYEHGDGVWSLVQTLRASDAPPDYCFGSSVAMDGGTIVVGAFANGYNSFSNRGRAIHVFERSGSTWGETVRFAAPFLDYSSFFGKRIDVSGDTIVTTSWRAVTSAGAVGTVYVYRRIGGVWAADGEVPAPAGEYAAFLGSGVALNEHSLVVTGHRGDSLHGNLRWSIFLYDRSGSSWKLRQEISTSVELMDSVALDGDTALVGGVFEGKQYGALLLKRDATGNWLEHAKVLSGDAYEFWSSYDLVYSLALSGDSAFIGTPQRDAVASNSGAVTAYEIAREPREVDLYAIRQLAVDEVALNYSAVGLTSAATVAIYRSVDATFDVSDLLFPVTSFTIQPGQTSGEFAIRPGAVNSQRPYLVAVATAGGDEHRTDNNIIAIKQLVPEGLEIGQQLPSLTDVGTISSLNVIAIDGDRAVLGTPPDRFASDGTGSAYVLRRLDGAWVVEAQLSTPVGTPLWTEFGGAAAISGNTIVVGARLDKQSATEAGAAYVYVFDGTSWVLQTKLLGRYEYDWFGSAVAIEGGVIVVGARGAGYSYYDSDGAAYIYEMREGAWAQVAQVTGQRSQYQYSKDFGRALALSDTWLAVGAGLGEVLLFEKTATGWVFRQLAVSPEAHSDDGYGTSFDLDGMTLVVGAPRVEPAVISPDAQQNVGAAYVYEFVGGRWQFVQRLHRATSLPGSQFGTSVSIGGDTIAVSATRDPDSPTRNGSVSVYRRRDDGQWIREQKLTDGATAARTYFFGAVAVSRGVLLAAGVVGDYSTNGPFGSPGIINSVAAVHAFHWDEPAASALRGDFDADGDVDGADFLTWQRTLGQPAVPAGSGADGDGSGVTDGGDLSTWAEHFGEPLAPVALAAATPSSSSQSAAALDALYGAGDFTQLFPPSANAALVRRRYAPPRRI